METIAQLYSKEVNLLAKSTKGDANSSKRRLPPAITPEARENQLISLAYDLVEQRLIDGTATSAETTAVLRLGTQKARLEREKLEQEVKLAAAKTDAIESQKKTEELMEKAIAAMRAYSGAGTGGEEYEDIF
jgi:hypothetical protein